ncbi:MAG: carbohydrate ABC transporter permease, partial [Saccharofermentanales bacterium]
VAYSFARLRWPGRDVLFVILLGTLMLPSQVLQVQNFILFNNLNWINTYLPLTVPFFFNAGAFNIFLLRQFYKGVPMELSEAAKIDGCGEFALWIKIVTPLCKPIIAAIAIFAFMGGWNDFFNPLIYLRSDDLKTLALGLRDFQQQHGTQWNYMMAVSLISMVPTLVLFFSFQKYFVEGLTAGAIKG